MTSPSSITPLNSALIPYVPTSNGAEQQNQIARPDQIATTHELMIQSPVSTANKKIQTKINELLNPVQDLEHRSRHSHFTWSQTQVDLLTEYLQSGKSLSGDELEREVNSLATEKNEIHHYSGIMNKLSQLRITLGMRVPKKGLLIGWNSKQIELVTAVVKSREILCSEELMNRVNELADDDKQKHNLGAVKTKRSRIRRELGINSRTNTKNVQMLQTGIADLQSDAIGELQKQHKELKLGSNNKRIRWSNEQIDLLTQHLASGKIFNRQALYRDVNELAKDQYEIHTEAAFGIQLSEIRKQLGLRVVKKGVPKGWNPKQIELLTTAVQSGKKLNSQKLMERVNDIAGDSKQEHTKKAVIAKCVVIRKELGISGKNIHETQDNDDTNIPSSHFAV